uniref:Transmembrane protein 245 n=1 Tax=Acrobeloides nanus TaxID=290746 RepID=A0A914CRK4_9BILA
MAEGELINKIATNHDQKTALQFAFYNTLLFVLVGVCLAGLYAVYNMMHMFLTPILWAVLIGTVLFPIKRRLSSALKGWLNNLDETNTPLVIGLTLWPYERFCDFSDNLMNIAFSAIGVYSLIAFLIIKILSYKSTLLTLLSMIGKIYEVVDGLIAFFIQKWFLPIFLLYTLAYGAWIYVQDRQTIHKKFARSLSIPIWILLLAYISELFGVFRVLVFLCSCIVLALISAKIIGADIEEDGNGEAEGGNGEAENAHEGIASVPAQKFELKSEARLDTALSGDAHIRIISALCLLLFLARHDFMLVLIFLPLFFAILRLIFHTLNVKESLGSLFLSVYEHIRVNFYKMINIVVPGPLRKFIHLLFTSDRLFVSGLTKNIDLISSISVMTFLALGTLFMAFFMAFQLHSEVAHLVKLGGNVVSSNPDWFKYVSNFTEDQMKEIDVDNYVEQAYQQGRVWLSSNIRSLADPKDGVRADQLEKQAQILIDNLYRLWEERNKNAIYNASENALASENGDGWLTHFISTVNVNALRIEVTQIVQENIETVLTILRSLWSVVAVNISVLSSVLFAILGFILGFGFDILNSVIETVVFLTMVYYLLASSNDQWLPLFWLSRFSESFTQDSDESRRTDITGAVENAISGVFVLSAKMSIFYGLYTYFVHSLFDLNVVFIPSIFAAVFAAIPLMPPYIVAIIGVFELYLVRGETAAAIIFALSSFAPLTFADAAFYIELKGSHPYVTGLAVIGGMYWLGLQGAIIGPIVLCSLIVLINVYTQFARS